VTIILDFRFAIFDCRNRRQRVAVIKATTDAARSDVRGMFVKGMGKKDFPMIPLPFIPLTSFL